MMPGGRALRRTRYPARYDEEGSDFDWATATDEELLTKFGVLSAWYLPGPEGDATSTANDS